MENRERTSKPTTTEVEIMEESLKNPDFYQIYSETDNDPSTLVCITENDESHPFNWSGRKKVAHTIGFSFATMIVQFGSTAITGTLEQITRQHHVGHEIGALAYGIMLAGCVAGPVLFAPLSEIYGRKFAVFAPSLVYGILTILTAIVTTMWAVVILRFFAGVFAAGPIVVAAGAIADIWQPKKRVLAIFIYVLNIVIGSSVSPVVGAALTCTGSNGWRWTFCISGLLSVIDSIISAFALSECYLPVIEQRKARSCRLKSGNWAIHAKNDEWALELHDILKVHITRPLLFLFTPVLSFVSLYAAFVYGVTFLLIGNVGELFKEVHHFGPITSQLPLLSFIGGYLIGGMFDVMNVRRYSDATVNNESQPKPEVFLGATMVLGWTMPAGCFIYGWTMYSHVHWIGGVIGLGVFAAGFAVVFQGCLVYSINAFNRYSASVVATNVIVRSIFAAVFPLFGSQMYRGLNPRWASSLLGFISVALTPVPWLLYKYGPRLREVIPFKQVL